MTLCVRGLGMAVAGVDPSFDSKCISYLDRGMVFAIANIRGVLPRSPIGTCLSEFRLCVSGPFLNPNSASHFSF